MVKKSLAWALPTLLVAAALAAGALRNQAWSHAARHTLALQSGMAESSTGCRLCCGGQESGQINSGYTLGGGSGTGNGENFCALYPAPVNYTTGENMYRSVDVKVNGWEGLSETRVLTQEAAYADPTLGPGWRRALPKLVDLGSKIAIVTGARHSRTWIDNGTSYGQDYFYKETLSNSLDIPATAQLFRDEDGNGMTFYHTANTADPDMRGKIYLTWSQLTDGSNTGMGTLYSYFSSPGTFKGELASRYQSDITNGFLDSTQYVSDSYTYDFAYPNNRVTNYNLSKTTGGTTQSLRGIEYNYYTISGANGPAGALQRVKIIETLQPAFPIIDIKYYRYYDTQIGGQYRVKHVVEGEAYERLRQAVGGTDALVDSASDATVEQYAQLKFFYDATGRVSQENVQGQGSVAFGAQTTNPSWVAGQNNWKFKTIVTLSNNDQEIIYTNSSAQLVGKVIKEASPGTREWRTWYERDVKGRIIQEATSEAITTFTESFLDLVSTSPGVYTNLNTTGLISLTEYAATTTATSVTPGDVADYVKARRIKQGKAGTAVNQAAYTYIAHSSTAGITHTIYPLASETVYEDTAGTQARTTQYAYTWRAPNNFVSNRIDTKTTTYHTVSTGKNGSGSPTSRVEYIDLYGNTVWVKDEEGYIHASFYDKTSNMPFQVIQDVNTVTYPSEPPGWVTPAGGGLNLEWNYQMDWMGRHAKITDPEGRITYIVIFDASQERRIYSGWTGTATTGPTHVTRVNRAAGFTEMFTTSLATGSSGGIPLANEVYTGATLTASNLHSSERTFRDTAGRPIQVDTYHTFAAPYTNTTTTWGTLGTHFQRRSMSYDVRGRAVREVDWTGTISRAVPDAQGRTVSRWVGTDDTPTSGAWSPTNLAGTNTTKTNEYVYDGGAAGSGRLTTSKTFTAAATSLDSVYQYDFRGRLTDSRGPTSVTVPVGVAVKKTYNNLNRVTMEETYASADFTYTAGELRSRREAKFDEKGQVYQSITHHVNGSGAVGNRLTTNFWWNGRRLGIKVKGPNGEFQKTAYDGLGRVAAEFRSYHDAETAYGDADDVATDTVIDQAVYLYDKVGGLRQATRYERTNSTAKTGDLSVSWAEADSRRTFSANWYDLAARLTHSAEYGRNGGSTFTWTGTPPTPNTSNVVLVTKHDYHSGSGRQYRITDNKNRVTELTFDMQGRATKAVENYVDGIVGNAEYASDRTTERTYDASGRLSQLRARNPKGASVENQDTKYVYGTDANLASPAVWRNDILVAEIYPDSDDTYNAGGAAGAKLGNGVDATYDRVEYTYDYASRRLTHKKQLTTTHTYTYDTVGRRATDQATTLGSGIDGAVRRVEFAYDDLWRTSTVSSYSATAGGTLLNQVGYSYDGWGQETSCTQGHEGTSTGAPGYTKTFADGAALGEAKYVRLASMTYPNGRLVYQNYPTGVGDKLSRVDNVANDAAGTLKFAQYTCLGVNSIVKVAHPGVTGGLNLDYGTGTGNPGGWDDVGRIDDQKWQNDAASVKDRYQYGYDNTSNRTFRDNLTATAKDQFYVIDGLDRVTTDKRGDLNAGRTDITGTPAFQETWTLEGSGNWSALVQTTAGVVGLNQTRTHTKANETTTIAASVGTNWGDGVSDREGHMTRVPKPGTPNELWEATYDAWSRLVKVVNNVGAVTIAEYKYDGLHRRIAKLKPNGANWDRRDYYYSCEWQVVEEREILNTASKTTVATVPKFQIVWDPRYIDAAVLRDENKNGDGDCTDAGPTDQRLYYTQDANMSVTGLVDTAGTVVERVVYDTYGKHALFQANWTTSQASTVYNNEVLYAGYRLDPETGLYQVRHRVYHPTLGKWVQRDPGGYEDGGNLYEYVRSRSPLLRDPWGLKSQDAEQRLQDQLRNDYKDISEAPAGGGPTLGGTPGNKEGECPYKAESLKVTPPTDRDEDYRVNANRVSKHVDMEFEVTEEMTKENMLKCCKMVFWVNGHARKHRPGEKVFPLGTVDRFGAKDISADSDNRWTVDSLDVDPTHEYTPEGKKGKTFDNPSGAASLHYRRLAKHQVCVYNAKDIKEFKIYSGLHANGMPRIFLIGLLPGSKALDCVPWEFNYAVKGDATEILKGAKAAGLGR